MSSGFGVVRSRGEKQRAIELEKKYKVSSGGLDSYADPPVDEHSIEFLRDCAMDRYQLLKAIDNAVSAGKKGDELDRAIREAEEKFNLRRVTVTDENYPSMTEDGSVRDSLSHHILRLAHCGGAGKDDGRAQEERSEKASRRNWFKQMETRLFEYRFRQLSRKEQRLFLASNPDYKSFRVPDREEVLLHQRELAATLESDHDFRNNEAKKRPDGKMTTPEFGRICQEISRQSDRWYAVEFEEVTKSLKTRSAYMVKGEAWVQKGAIVELVEKKFTSHLGLALAKTIRIWEKVKLNETNRLVPLLHSVVNGKSYAYTGPEGVVSIAKIEGTRDSFPLCMRQLYGALKKKHHLTHNGRRQLQLYLKGIGLPLEEAIVFWKTEFTKSPECSAEKFEKDYAYGIRHAYGKEGKRVNYTPHGCQQCIAADPGVRDDHGCPFKTLTCGEHKNGEKLHEMLTHMNISGGKSREIVDKAKNMHYQIACGMTFAALHNGKEIDAGVHTPHQYYAESRKILAPPEEKAEVEVVAAN